MDLFIAPFLQAATVFVLASVFFCHRQPSQCFNVYKVVGTVAVCGGVVAYNALPRVECLRSEEGASADRSAGSAGRSSGGSNTQAELEGRDYQRLRG